MRIQVKDVVVGVAAGAIDEVTEWQDGERGMTEPFKNITDWARVGLCALGYLGEAFNFFPAIAKPLAQSESTLVTKSISRVIQTQMGTQSSVTHASRTSTPASRTSAPASRRVGWRPIPIGT